MSNSYGGILKCSLNKIDTISVKRYVKFHSVSFQLVKYIYNEKVNYCQNLYFFLSNSPLIARFFNFQKNVYVFLNFIRTYS